MASFTAAFHLDDGLAFVRNGADPDALLFIVQYSYLQRVMNKVEESLVDRIYFQ